VRMGVHIVDEDIRIVALSDEGVTLRFCLPIFPWSF
jgi:hypothetical protein